LRRGGLQPAYADIQQPLAGLAELALQARVVCCCRALLKLGGHHQQFMRGQIVVAMVARRRKVGLDSASAAIVNEAGDNAAYNDDAVGGARLRQSIRNFLHKGRTVDDLLGESMGKGNAPGFRPRPEYPAPGFRRWAQDRSNSLQSPANHRSPRPG